MRVLVASMLFCLAMAACSDSSDDSTNPSPKDPTVSAVGEITDTSLQGITAFVQQGSYKTWAAEAAVHDGSGAHGKVRSFFNATLTASIKAKNTVHPQGSISVKELYSSDGTTIVGYAVEAKTSAAAGGDSWLWYEGFSPRFDQYYGQGLSTCTVCHARGTDYVYSMPAS